MYLLPFLPLPVYIIEWLAPCYKGKGGKGDQLIISSFLCVVMVFDGSVCVLSIAGVMLMRHCHDNIEHYLVQDTLCVQRLGLSIEINVASQ